ncbi:hypothetical protein LINPERPRIM_LOCUS11121, partial [Linum perenne]
NFSSFSSFFSSFSSSSFSSFSSFSSLPAPVEVQWFVLRRVSTSSLLRGSDGNETSTSSPTPTASLSSPPLLATPPHVSTLQSTSPLVQRIRYTSTAPRPSPVSFSSSTILPYFRR